MKAKVIVIGAGPAGLFCSYLLLKKGYSVDLYDHSSGPGKKFLIAGNGGLNLTHSEELDKFASKYGKNSNRFKNLLEQFSASDLRSWFKEELGLETFVGSSGRIFPEKMQAGEALVNWIKILKSYEGFNLYLKHKFIKINKDKELTFEFSNEKIVVKADSIVFGLGGASWKKTGSDGLWKENLEELGLKINEFLPMNCGFERSWSEFFKKNIQRSYIKNVEVFFNEKSVKGDLMLTPYGVEGGPIYALSNFIRDELRNNSTYISIDLKPGLSEKAIFSKIENRNKKVSLSNHLRKSLGFSRNIFIFLKELLEPEVFESMEELAKNIKSLKVSLEKPRPINEAISTSGGICFSNLNESLEFKNIEGIYFCGEMLDYEAPTGGYLLQSCFSTAWKVANSISS